MTVRNRAARGDGFWVDPVTAYMACSFCDRLYPGWLSSMTPACPCRFRRARLPCGRFARLRQRWHLEEAHEPHHLAFT